MLRSLAWQVPTIVSRSPNGPDRPGCCGGLAWVCDEVWVELDGCFWEHVCEERGGLERKELAGQDTIFTRLVASF